MMMGLWTKKEELVPNCSSHLKFKSHSIRVSATWINVRGSLICFTKTLREVVMVTKYKQRKETTQIELELKCCWFQLFPARPFILALFICSPSWVKYTDASHFCTTAPTRGFWCRDEKHSFLHRVDVGMQAILLSRSSQWWLCARIPSVLLIWNATMYKSW